MSRSIVVEFHHDGNRPLGRDDSFLDGQYGESEVAEFFSLSAATAAARRAKNRRDGSRVEVISRAERATA